MTSADDDHKPRQPPSFFALGYAGLPNIFTIADGTFSLTHAFKHDFFAATGLYTGTDGRQVVLKIQRTYPFFGVPLAWLGARIARHEVAVFRQLQGIVGIPDFLGTYGPTGYVHSFVPGQDLNPELKPDGAFFDDLARLLSQIHQRNVAYVDTNKRENILFGSDGKPHLIDFQISFWLRQGRDDSFMAQWLFKRLVHEDWYHYFKHKTRLAPAFSTPVDFQRAENRSWYIRLHRLIFRPLIRLRRKFLARFRKPGHEAA